MSNDRGFGIIRSGDKIEMTITETYQQIKQHLTFTRDESLAGVPIRLTYAAEKYNVNYQTLQRWAESGLIGTVNTGPKLLELDEADVKLAAAIFNTAKKYTKSRRASWILKKALQRQPGN